MLYRKSYSASNGGNDCGTLVFMIDRSGSMNELLDNGQTKSEMAASVINRTIEKLCSINHVGCGNIKDNARVVVVSYSDEVKIEQVGFLSELFKNPLDVVESEQKVPDGNGGLVSVKRIQRIWTKPISAEEQGCTSMAAAFDTVTSLLRKVINPSNPAPIVINISDGLPKFPIEGVDYTEENMSEVLKSSLYLTNKSAEELTSLQTDDGNVLLYNVYIGGGKRVLYPSDESDLGSDDIGMNFLFKISSKIPEAHLKPISGLSDGAKGLVINPDEVPFVEIIYYLCTF